jgi:predicted Zn-dependent protease
MQRFGDAITDFDRASSLDPVNEELTIDRARVKVKAGRIREAIAELSLTISLHPLNLDAFKGRDIDLPLRSSSTGI